MEKVRKYFYWNYLWLILFAAGFGIFLMVMPKCADDFWFLVEMKWWFDQQGLWNPDDGGNPFRYGIPWQSLLETIRLHIEIDNSRFCNMVGPFMLLFPKWFGSFFSWIALLFSVGVCMRLACIDIKKSRLVRLCIGLWTLTFPWYEIMGSLIFQYNFIVSGALGLGLVFWLRRGVKGYIVKILFIIYCFVTAFWHEGFTVPLFLSFLVVFICFRQYCKTWSVIAFIILGIGIAWHISGAVNLYQIHQHNTEISLNRLLKTLYYQRSIWVALTVSAIYIVKRGCRKFFANPIVVFMLVGGIVSFGQSYFTEVSRAAWWADIASVVITLVLLKELEIFSFGYEGLRGWLSGIILICSFVEIVALDVHAVLLKKEFPVKLKNYLSQPEKSQFSKLVDYPWYSLPFTQIIPVNYSKYAECIEYYYRLHNYKGKQMQLLPEGLRNISQKDCEILDGGLGYLKYDRYVIMETDSVNRYLTPLLRVDYGWFTKDRYLKCIPFVSEADGRRYVYVQPYNGATEYEIGNIKGIYKIPGLKYDDEEENK